jgi:ATP-binding cassette subfamily B protein
VIATLGRILRFWKPHRAVGFGLAVTMLLRAVFTVVLALAVKFVIDRVVEPDTGSSAWMVAVFLLVGFAVSFAAGLVAARLGAKATADIIADVRSEAFDHLQRLSLGYHDRAATGDLMAHFSSDIAQLSRGVIRKPLIGLRALAGMTLYVPVMFILDPRLAAAAVIGIPGVVWLVYRFAPESASALDEEKQRIADVLDEVSVNLRAQKIIRAYALGSRSEQRFRRRIDGLRDASERAEARISFEMVIAEYAVEFTKLAIIVAGAWLAFSGQLDPGSFAAFAAILMEFSYQATVLGMDVFPSIKQSEAGIRRIDSLLSVEPPAERTGDGDPPPLHSTIDIRDVVFRYHRGQDPRLDGVSLTVPERSHVAIVGPNGSGKSSLLNVLLGLYDFESGTVVIGGRDLRELDIEKVRRRAGVAFQETVLFDGTLRENIVLGADDIDDDALDRAVRDSGLLHVIEHHTDGVDAEVGPVGVSLSTGEAQRVGVARALLRDPELLMLDEVASGLDPESEADLMGVIEHLRAGRTIISITHRLESVKTADRIVVVDDGAVVESGAFDELLAAGGTFASMWTKQHGFDVSANGLTARVHAERLGQIPVFAGLGDPALRDLAAAFESRFVEHGEIVFGEGDRGDAFYVIARGVAEVVRGLGTPDEHVIAHLEDGDFFGEMALLTTARRNATVRSKGATTLLRLDLRAFNQLMATVPGARTIIESTASARAAENARVDSA